MHAGSLNYSWKYVEDMPEIAHNDSWWLKNSHFQIKNEIHILAVPWLRYFLWTILKCVLIPRSWSSPLILIAILRAYIIVSVHVSMGQSVGNILLLVIIGFSDLLQQTAFLGPGFWEKILGPKIANLSPKRGPKRGFRTFLF